MITLLELALSLVVVAIILYLTWALLATDCDLTLTLVEKYGKPISSFSGRVVWVTGASTGLGEAMAYELAAVGTKLILTARSTDLLQKVKEECLRRSEGKLFDHDILVLPFDLSNFECHKQNVQRAVDHFERIDVLINNAARYSVGAITETDISVDKAIFEVNFFGTLSLTKTVIKQFLQQGYGHIVVVSSIAGKFGIPSTGSYSATKHALHGFFDTLRMEVQRYGITVTTVVPGIFSSNIFEKTITTQTEKVLEKEYHHYECENMTSERCAHLALVAAANRLYESWIAFQPFLFMLWGAQYTPNFYKYIMSVLYTKKRLGELYEGKWPRDLPVWRPLTKKENVIR
ncbi:dehydrogenase/reductase SDR family member 7-like [Parasteatoda tepidariorum]|uniref:dehydrogenase/reductase SDR family member 7-like n=1 Tax=Parasteatoda tepidariorum TaxID=114398 RepID=UPI00077FB068|nr:dehydrogenase/reductase SDR family member 7-like [Parasteatoda tepidariorum]XP_015912471.1 dehydrogenase/reductase SDR family member 7-like [Parasteatoda tepidariorum]XP_015912472.1 dehydrogenase/reductase SDR family member 7-like [Parasteatoda tepidariorum]